MEWNDDAIVLSSRAHGETGAILELLTRDHGRHAGLVRGGASRRVKPTLQPGNSVHVQWRARLEEHLGSFTCELARARAKKIKNILCVEEHNKSSGLASLVAEAVGDIPGVTIRRLGIPDEFLTAYGSFEEISHDIGIDTVGIKGAIEQCLKGGG